METLRFEYRPNVWFVGFGGALFTAATVVLIYLTLSLGDGAVIERGRQIHHGSGKVLGWAMVMGSTILTFMSLRVLKQAFGPIRYVIVDEHAISAPKGPSSKTTENIPLAEITNLNVYSLRHTPYLQIRHNHGHLTISGDMLGRRYNFDQLVETLRERSSAQQT